MSQQLPSTEGDPITPAVVEPIKETPKPENPLQTVETVSTPQKDDSNLELSKSETQKSETSQVQPFKVEIENVVTAKPETNTSEVKPKQEPQIIPENFKPIDEKDLQECFYYFDTNGDNMLTAEQLKYAIRAFGVNLETSKMDEIITQNDSNSSGLYSLDTYINIMKDKKKDTDKPEKVTENFAIFDKEKNGYVSATELKNVLTTMGDKLTEQEVEDLYKVVVPIDGFISVEDLIKNMCLPFK
ncbi:calmodulin-1/4, putative [Entamoeba invadens IP1]|uniref:calmodulin-1/4, putative n=1 Tax=Entamoeba invadens IP1 TaxID=370355 RepID=UPI0002C3DAE3|nr:calmodulin-1/4, putative [Entamoeba invadens IP1]ELP93239.1 calmodulin-1/4, putative [Entamoeba invadens IP1]|eukprot:XP_004260010.1 calmodulin-1/4, putative [Entamoeba invadens IP1]